MLLNTLNSEITNKKHKNAKKVALVYSKKGETKRMLSVSAGSRYSGQLEFFAVLYISVNDHKSTLSVDFGVTNKY